MLRLVGRISEEQHIPCFGVGGIVRDILLDRETTDIDFVTVGTGSGIALAEAVGSAVRGARVTVFKNFGTASVALPAADARFAGVRELEFVAARRESYSRDSRNPAVEDGTLEDDQRRRDFTINAMAIGITSDSFGELIDLFGGVSDLNQGLLRTPLEPVETFSDDPLRILRAARFASQLQFTVDTGTLDAMTASADRLEIVSAERISTELRKIMCSDRPSVGWGILFRASVLDTVFPELAALQGVETVGGQRHKDNFYHTLEVVDNLVDATMSRSCEQTEWLRWAALLHDIGKPRTKRFKKGTGWTFHGHEDVGARMIPSIFRKLRLPLDERLKYVVHLVQLHHRPVALVDDAVTDSAVRRLIFDAGDALEDLMTLVRADITSKNPRRVRRYLNAFEHVEEKMVDVEERDRLRTFQPPVDGAEIMTTLNLKPGKSVGLLKEAIREAILNGEIPNEHDAAFEYLLQIKDDILGTAAAGK